MKEMYAWSHEVSVTTTAPAQSALARSGVRALMLAILEDAIQCLRSSDRLLRSDAEHWITRRDSGYVFSFIAICDILELDPSAVRRSVMQGLGKAPAPGRSRRNARRSGPMPHP